MHDHHATRAARPHAGRAGFRPRALVFDLDGTLTDNMAVHAEAFATFMRRHGMRPMTMADRRRYDGKRNAEIFPAIFGRPLDREELLALEDEKESIYREISRGQLRPVHGLLPLLDAARAHGLAVAVATSAPRANVEHSLEELGQAWLLDHVVRGDQVPRGKPFPDVFLEAARRLGVAPAGCLGFEDAPVGVEAVVAAGMACVALTTSFDEATLMASPVPPDLCLPDFAAYLAGPGAWLHATPSTSSRG